MTSGHTDTDAGPASVVWFADLGRDDTATAGGKGANLGELTAAGLPVPPGFVVTADAYRAALVDGGVDAQLASLFEHLDADDAPAVAEAAKRAEELVRDAGMSDALRTAVLDAYRRLDPGVPVAVRSSATAEDSADTSFAGMNETYTNVEGEQELCDRILDCWASMYAERVVAYRARTTTETEPAIAVVVQRMVRRGALRGDVLRRAARRPQAADDRGGVRSR